MNKLCHIHRFILSLCMTTERVDAKLGQTILRV
ncbi:Uncharacterised protein [Salmonella enterica]|nr:hypothetical protein SEEJ0720_05398 [Salmonella enterica subsp. enterica serovar Javiana str. PRS_2010_0720]SUE86722.1 Uncharacterised protein [Salmonella enterica]